MSLIIIFLKGTGHPCKNVKFDHRRPSGRKQPLLLTQLPAKRLSAQCGSVGCNLPGRRLGIYLLHIWGFDGPLQASWLQGDGKEDKLGPFQIVGGCWDVMGGRALRWRWGAEGRSPARPRGSPPRQNDTTGVRSKGRRVRFQSGPRRSTSLVRVRERERRRFWISRIFLRFRTRRRGTPEPTPDPGASLMIIEWTTAPLYFPNRHSHEKTIGMGQLFAHMSFVELPLIMSLVMSVSVKLASANHNYIDTHLFRAMFFHNFVTLIVESDISESREIQEMYYNRLLDWRAHCKR